MKAEQLARMNAKELDAYAQAMGIDISNAKSATSKVKIITQKRERVATISTLGMDLDIPIKRARDKRVSDILTNQNATDDDLAYAMTLLLGEEQMAEVEEVCTDEDGTVDVCALATVFSALVTSDELKNF